LLLIRPEIHHEKIAAAHRLLDFIEEDQADLHHLRMKLVQRFPGSKTDESRGVPRHPFPLKCAGFWMR
jgi:hypothetical protein